MAEDEEMHALVVRVGDRWIDLFPQVGITLYLKGIGHPTGSPVLNIALFKHERCVPSHILVSPVFLPLLINYDIELIDRLYFLPIHLKVHFDDVSGLLSHDVI